MMMKKKKKKKKEWRVINQAHVRKLPSGRTKKLPPPLTWMRKLQLLTGSFMASASHSKPSASGKKHPSFSYNK